MLGRNRQHRFEAASIQPGQYVQENAFRSSRFQIDGVADEEYALHLTRGPSSLPFMRQCGIGPVPCSAVQERPDQQQRHREDCYLEEHLPHANDHH